MEKFTNRMDLRNDRISGLESNIQELKHSVNYKDKLIKNTWRKPLRSIGHHRKPKSVIHTVPSFLGHLCLSTPDRALQSNTMILPKSSLENQWVPGLQKTDDSQAAESLRSPFCMGNDSWKLRSQSSPQDPGRGRIFLQQGLVTACIIEGRSLGILKASLVLWLGSFCFFLSLTSFLPSLQEEGL